MDKKIKSGLRKKHMIGPIVFIALVIVCSGLWVRRNTTVSAAGGKITLNFHYSRSDDECDNRHL